MRLILYLRWLCSWLIRCICLGVGRELFSVSC